jgi:hypothetical protein
MNGFYKNQKKIIDYLLKHKDSATETSSLAYFKGMKAAAKEHILNGASGPRRFRFRVGFFI